ncbi:ImmA/IrrE family metallo-endopeptidase [Angustibacter aerolatus]
MRTSRWSPWGELARHPDIWVHRCRLQEGRGWWVPSERVILLDAGLDRRTARCVLAHELAHALLGHTWPEGYRESGWLAARLERQADRWAAERLLPVDVLAPVLAERRDPDATAQRLDVTPELLRTRLAALTADERQQLAGDAPGDTRRMDTVGEAYLS